MFGGDKRKAPQKYQFQKAFPHHKIIIAHSGKNPQEYRDNFDALKGSLFQCPVCGSLTHINQINPRSCWTEEEQQKIPQLQVKCTNINCCKTHSVIPDFLSPYKRYLNIVIESELNANSGIETNSTVYVSCAEESTARRWIKQFKARYALVKAYLFRLVFERYQAVLNILENHSPYEELKTLMNYSGSLSTGVLGKANTELFSSEKRQFF